MTHLLLLTLAVFYLWETARAVLPFALPGAVNALALVAISAGLQAWVPDRYLALGAVAAVAAVLHQRFGAEHMTRPFTFRFPTSTKAAARAAGRIPPLP